MYVVRRYISSTYNLATWRFNGKTILPRQERRKKAEPSLSWKRNSEGISNILHTTTDLYQDCEVDRKKDDEKKWKILHYTIAVEEEGKKEDVC